MAVDGTTYVGVNLMPAFTVTFYRPLDSFGFAVFTSYVMAHLTLNVQLGSMMMQFMRPKPPRPPDRKLREVRI